MERLPLLAVELVEELNKEFPHRCPGIDTPERKIWFKAGQRAVVDYLLRILEEQKDNLLNDKGD